MLPIDNVLAALCRQLEEYATSLKGSENVIVDIGIIDACYFVNIYLACIRKHNIVIAEDTSGNMYLYECFSHFSDEHVIEDAG